MSAPSATVQAKAGQYLLERRVRVDYADQRSFVGLVDGSRAHPYLVMWAGGWRCDCPATATCAHVVACQAVWSPQPAGVGFDVRELERGTLFVTVPEPRPADPFDLLPDYD